jgi:hypothetical protein
MGVNMAWKDEYYKDGSLYSATINVGYGQVTVHSGELHCDKCGKPIPPKELFCIPCYGKEVPKPKRYEQPRPDKGGLLAGLESQPKATAKAPQTCRKCQAEYTGLICGVCALKSHEYWLHGQLGARVMDGVKLVETKDGHLTLPVSEWTKVFAVVSVRASSSQPIVAACEASLVLGDVGVMPPWKTECAKCREIPKGLRLTA